MNLNLEEERVRYREYSLEPGYHATATKLVRAQTSKLVRAQSKLVTALEQLEQTCEALEAVLDRVCSREYDYDDFPSACKALYNYKQSRGD